MRRAEVRIVAIVPEVWASRLAAEFSARWPEGRVVQQSRYGELATDWQAAAPAWAEFAGAPCGGLPALLIELGADGAAAIFVSDARPGFDAGREMEALIAGADAGPSAGPPLAVLPIPQGSRTTSARWADDLAAFASSVTETSVLGDFPRPPRLSGHMHVAVLRLAKAFGGKIERTAADEARVLAITSAWLARLSGQPAQMLGWDENGDVLPLAVTVPLGASFSTHAQRCAEILAAARADGVPCQAELLAALEAKAGAAFGGERAPLLQVTVAYEFAEAHATSATKRPLFSNFSPLDLSLKVLREGDELFVVLASSRDLFTGETTKRLLGHWETMWRSSTAAASSAVANLPMLRADEEQQILHGFNAALAPFPRGQTLHGLLNDAAVKFPQKVALIFADESLSFRALDAAANRLARHLRSLGVREGTLVGLCLEKSVDLVIAIFAILKAGGAYVPLDPSYPPERLDMILSDAKPLVLVTNKSVLARLKVAVDCEIVDLDAQRGGIARYEETPLPHDTSATADTSLAYVIYTSGSTGKPKGVLVPHDTVLNFLHAMRKTVRFGSEEVTLCANSVAFDIVIPDLFLSAMTGTTLVLAAKDAAIDGEGIIDLIARHRVTNMLATPTTWQILLECGWKGAPALRIIAAGEALPSALANALRGLGKSLWNAYGPTEVSVIATFYEVLDATRPVFIGKPIDNVAVYILDPFMQLVPIGVAGEIFIGGAGVTRGYLGRDDLTRERFLRDPFAAASGAGLRARMYKTGDVGRFAADGRIEYLGRNDDQVKVRGFRIELGEVKEALQAHLDVATAAASAPVLPGAGGERTLVAYFVRKEGSVCTEADLRAFLHTRLPRQMVPSHLIEVDEFPVNANGKLDTKRLPLPGGHKLAGTAFSEEPPAKGQVAAASKKRDLEAILQRVWGEVLGVEAIAPDANFFSLGGTSLLAVRMVQRLKREYGLAVAVLALFEHPTIAGLLPHVNSAQAKASLETSGAGEPLGKANGDADNNKIAIVGMALRVPGANSVDEFWKNLLAGRSSIRRFRRDELDSLIPQAWRDDPRYVAARGVVANAECFDYAFFGMTLREAEVIDPAQRHFLQTAWSALEDAGYTPADFDGQIGVFAGAGTNTYRDEVVRRVPGLEDAVSAFAAMLANEKDYIATRVSNRFDLRGPSLSVQTACSTSLVAVHLAVQALRAGQCHMAIAGGSSFTAPLASGHLYQEGGMLSRDGETRSFADEATGTVFSDGVAAVVLKRLSDAVRDGDRVIAVIRGSAINNDGARKASFTAPSIDGQARVVRSALADAKIDARSISYVEGHGTGTPLGDPIELTALARAYGASGTKKYLGSLKSNVGHMVATAGVGGLIKTALALDHEVLPASLHCSVPTRQIDWSEVPFSVVKSPTIWPRSSEPRLAGISSFGVGGTNAHVILEEAPEQPTRVEAATRPEIFVFAAQTASALAAKCADFGAFAHQQNLLPIDSSKFRDAAFTSAVGRVEWPFRAAFAAHNWVDLADQLKKVGGEAKFQAAQTEARPVIFLFPGQGTQYADMARALYETEPAFRAAFDEADTVLHIRDVLFGDASTAADRAQRMETTALSQPVIFAVEAALAALWKSRGLFPIAVIGHSVGEFAAAVAAGILPLLSAARIVLARARAMQAMPEGAMLAAQMSEEDGKIFLQQRRATSAVIGIAAVNAPQSIVFGGEAAAIEMLAAELAAIGTASRRLATSHAFHTSMMAAAVAEIEHAAAAASFQPALIPFISTVDGGIIQAGETLYPGYFTKQVLSPVHFSVAVARAAALASELGEPLFLECGPRHALTAFVRQILPNFSARSFVGSLSEKAKTENDALAFAVNLGRVWCAGVKVAWRVHFAGALRRRVSLPAYPFALTRCWPNVPRTHVRVNADANANASIIEIPQVKLLKDDFMSSTLAAATAASSRTDRLMNELRGLVEDLAGVDCQSATATTTFLELGLDSLFLTQLAIKVAKTYKFKLGFRQLMEDLANFGALAAAIDASLPPEAAAPSPVAQVANTAPPAPQYHAPEPMRAVANSDVIYPQSQPTPQLRAESAQFAASSGLEAVISQQLAVMARQLDVLAGRASASGSLAFAPLQIQTAPAAPQPPPPQVCVPASATTPLSSQNSGVTAVPVLKNGEIYDAKKAFGAAARITLSDNSTLSSVQKRTFDEFVTRYCARTKESKRLTQFNRPWLADPRVVTGFRPKIKELVYQIIVDRSKGARLWDVDGNEYVDALCGFGMNFFGWSADFINVAVIAQLEKSMDIGPMTPLAGEVAQRLCEMTGFDRAGFCNTGSEAVMGCMRIARTVTGRDKIVTFAGSYHGIFDEVLQRGVKGGRAIPAAPGILENTSANVIIFEYGSSEALEYIKANAQDLAAVIAEPIQSRRADLQPKAFLEAVRAVTSASGTALVFDEVITGFRLAPGGAQEYFGIKADLASYGKVIGGGFPIGIIAGRKDWADALDGGFWKFGDDSKPEVGVTYFAGTFVRHPPALAAALAVLKRLKESGPALQRELNEKTAQLAAALNSLFNDAGVPLVAKHMGSLWRCQFTEELPFGDVLFTWMRAKGLHIFDGFPCFLTTAHTAEDLAFILRVFREAIAEMQAGDLLPGQLRRTAAAEGSRVVASVGPISPMHPPVPGARLGRDPAGYPAWFVPDPNQAGKFLKLN